MSWGAVRLVLTGDTWVPIWGKFAPKWAEHPHLGSRLPLPQLRGLWVGAGVFAALGSSPAHSEPSPGPQGNTYRHVFAAFAGLCGVHAHTSVLGEPLPEGEEKKPPNRGLGRWVPSCWGSSGAGAALSGTAGQENHFSPRLVITGILLPSVPPVSWVFSRHCCRGCPFLIPNPPFPMGERVWGSAAKDTSQQSPEGTAGVSYMWWDKGLCPTPFGTPSVPTEVLEAPAAAQTPHGTAVPSPGECRGAGTPCPSPPRAVMSSSTRNSSVRDYFPLSFWAVISGNGADSQEKYEISTPHSQDGRISTNQHFKRAWACVCSWEADEMIWGFEAAWLETVLSPREWGRSPLIPALISSGNRRFPSGAVKSWG